VSVYGCERSARCVVHTGPVSTLADFDVQVPTNEAGLKAWAVTGWERALSAVRTYNESDVGSSSMLSAVSRDVLRAWLIVRSGVVHLVDRQTLEQKWRVVI